MREPTIAQLEAEIKARREIEKFLCPKCAHFRAIYPPYGAVTQCDRTGYWEESSFTKRKCKDYKLKNEKKD